MKNLKKIISLALVFVMLFALTACQSGETGSDSSVTLSWMLPISEQPDEELIEAAVNEITEKELGVKVDLVCIDSSAYQERMNMNMAAGKDFDICFTGYVNKYQNAVYNGGLLVLDDLLKTVAPKLMETMPDYAWEVAKIDGSVYAVPNLQGFAPPTSVWFFKDLTDKYGFDPSAITHIEDCEPYFETLKKNEPNIIPFRLDYGVQHWVTPVWERITNGLVIRSDGSSSKVEIEFDVPEYKKGVAKCYEWYKKGYIRSDLISATSEEAEFKAGKFAAHGSGWLPGAEATQKEIYNREVAITPIMEPYMTKALSTAAMTGIGKNSKNPEKALQLIELVNTNKELINLLSIGIEGKHYNLDENGKYMLIENSGYVTSGAWLFGNQFMQILAQGQEDGVWEDTEKMNLEAKVSPIIGFVLDTDPIKNEISQVAAVTSEFSGKSFIVNNYADYDKFMAKLKEAGIERLRDEVQKQIDEYWAANH